jgi:hypothetical protein
MHGRTSISLRGAPAFAPLILLFGLLAGISSRQLAAQACCAITGLEAKGQTAAAKVTATGQSFEFRVSDRRLFDSLRVGQPVYANFKASQVSLDGKTPCCAILRMGGSPSVQDRVPQSKSQSEPGAGGGGGVTRTPTPSGSAHVDIVGRALPLEFVLKNRPSNVWASFTNSGATLPADLAAADPQPDWLVDGQLRTSDTTGNHPKGQVPTSGRRAWPQGSERIYDARFTLTPGLHEIRAAMPAQPTEVSTGNNTTIFPVMAGAPDLVAEYDEGFINNGSLNSSYSRYRFWTENKGDIPSPPCRIRVTLSYRPVVQPPLNQEAVAWTPYDPVFDDIPSIIQARKSGYIYTQIWYPAQVTAGGVKPDEQYKWEFVVDENDAVTEDNKANNKLTVQKTHPGFDKLVMGKNPW